MDIVNMLQAKSTLSHLVKLLENGEEQEIIIARNGRAVARLVPLEQPLNAKKIGVAKGQFEVPDDIDTYNAEIGNLFLGGYSL